LRGEKGIPDTPHVTSSSLQQGYTRHDHGDTPRHGAWIGLVVSTGTRRSRLRLIHPAAGMFLPEWGRQAHKWPWWRRCSRSCCMSGADQ